MQTFPFTGFVWLYYEYLSNHILLLLRTGAPQGAVVLVRSLRMKNRRRLAYGIVIDTCVTHVLFMTSKTQIFGYKMAALTALFTQF